MQNFILVPVMLQYFSVFMNNKQKCTVNHATPLQTPPKYLLIYIDIYCPEHIIFTKSHNIIITGTFINTSSPLKLYEITIFPAGSSAYYHIIIQFTKVPSHHYADKASTSNVFHGLTFHCRDLKYSDIVPNTITTRNKN